MVNFATALIVLIGPPSKKDGQRSIERTFLSFAFYTRTVITNWYGAGKMYAKLVSADVVPQDERGPTSLSPLLQKLQYCQI